MNITQENIDDLNALLKVSIEKKDYQEKVDKILTDYRKKVNMPGFRKGKVPMGIIRKQYGSSALGDELNKIVSEGLYDYVEKQNFEILGNPLPKNDVEIKGDFNHPDTFEFTYEIGISPKLDITLSGKSKFDYVKVKIDDKLIDKQVEDLTRRYGKLVAGDKVGEKDMVMCQMVELNTDESIKEGGVMNDSTVSMEFVEDEVTKKALLGKKKGDVVVVDPLKVSHGKHDCSHLLGIKEEEVDNISDKFKLTISEIKVMEPAEMNQELFDKLFGDGKVTSEKELRERIKKDMELMFEKDSDKIFLRRVSNKLIEKTDVPLPDVFLKRWIMVANKDEISEEQIEIDYENYARNLKWQLIQNAIFKANNLKVDQQEAVSHAKELLMSQYAQYGMPNPEEKELDALAKQVLSNDKEAQQIYDMVGESKLLKFVKDTVKINEEEVDYDKFVEIAKDANA